MLRAILACFAVPYFTFQLRCVCVSQAAYKLWEYTGHPLKFRTGHILRAVALVVGRKNSSATCPTPFPEMGRKNRFRKLVGVVALSHYRNIPDRYLRMRLRLGKPPNQNTYPQVAVLAQ